MAAVANATGLVPQARGLGFPACGSGASRGEVASCGRRRRAGARRHPRGGLEPPPGRLARGGRPALGRLRHVRRRGSLRRCSLRRLRRFDLTRRPRGRALAPVPPRGARARRQRGPRGADGRAHGVARAAIANEVACHGRAVRVEARDHLEGGAVLQHAAVARRTQLRRERSAAAGREAQAARLRHEYVAFATAAISKRRFRPVEERAEHLRVSARRLLGREAVVVPTITSVVVRRAGAWCPCRRRRPRSRSASPTRRARR